MRGLRDHGLGGEHGLAPSAEELYTRLMLGLTAVKQRDKAAGIEQKLTWHDGVIPECGACGCWPGRASPRLLNPTDAPPVRLHGVRASVPAAGRLAAPRARCPSGGGQRAWRSEPLPRPSRPSCVRQSDCHSCAMQNVMHLERQGEECAAYGRDQWRPPVSDRPTLTLYARVGKGRRRTSSCRFRKRPSVYSTRRRER